MCGAPCSGRHDFGICHSAKGKCEGRKSHAEKRPEVVAEARRLRRANPTTGERRSLQSRELAAKGYFNERGQPFNPKSVRAMIERK